MPLGYDLWAYITELLGYSHFTIDMLLKSTANGRKNTKHTSEPEYTNPHHTVLSSQCSARLTARIPPVRPNHINKDSPAYVPMKGEEVYPPDEGSIPKSCMLCPGLQETSRSEASGTVRPCMLIKSNGKILQNPSRCDVTLSATERITLDSLYDRPTGSANNHSSCNHAARLTRTMMKPIRYGNE
ncbi:hypothetical protein BJX96DRAFT_103109 [Aspergillus floccosus]